MNVSGLRWKTSSYTNGSGGACVELACTDPGTVVRDTKNRTGPVLGFNGREWASFLAEIKAGRFDLA